VTSGLSERVWNAYSGAASRWFVWRASAKVTVPGRATPSVREAADAPTIPIPPSMTKTTVVPESRPLSVHEAADAPTIPIPAVIPIPARTTPLDWLRSDLFAWSGLALSLILWVIALTSARIDSLPSAGLGLVTLLPVSFWASVGVLIASFCFAVTRRSTRSPVLAAYLLALVVILHATPAILYTTLRYSWAWKHIGVIDFISNNGIDFNLGGILGPYQGWPGFFALNSFLTSASGLRSALSYAQWALPLNDLLWLGPVILIARAFTADKRLVWTAAWLFTLGNWIGQDYLSPQAFAYFLYLTVLAVCIRWLWPYRTSDKSPLIGSKPTRYSLVACLLPVMAAIASSHQLTPFVLISALVLLAVFNQIRPRLLLPVAMSVITLGWLAYGARSWLITNSFQLVQGLGLPWSNASTHLVSQGGGVVPHDQILIDWTARGLSAAIGFLGIIGFLRHRRRHNGWARVSWRRVALLATAPIPALAANNYGGEILFRVYLFAVPFLAIAAAAAFFPHTRAGRSIITTLTLLITVLLLSVGYSISNFGQESVNYFTPHEVAASDWLYRTAPRGATIVGANSNFPWAFVHYNWYNYAFLDSIPGAPSVTVLHAPVKTVVNLMEQGNPPPPTAYVILARSQEREIESTGEWPTSGYPRLIHDLLASGRFRVVYRNPDALILQLAEPRTGSGKPLCAFLTYASMLSRSRPWCAFPTCAAMLSRWGWPCPAGWSSVSPL
jgi:hypothetical protein